jgi:NAD(P)-dependent dehydrogenase (short-subunit alcohol dehydrogenase family)
MADTSAAIVTGHSRGLGAAIAGQLLTRGVRVLGVARHANADLAARFPVAFAEHLLDLSDAGAVDDWLRSGSIDRYLAGAHTALLVNNAGVLQPLGPLEIQDVGRILGAVTVNVAAALALSAEFAAGTRSGLDRRILHISSGAGRKGYAGWSVYCASKAALDNHARAVTLDKSPGLRICSVAPGVIDTEMQAEIRASSDDNVPDRPRFVTMHREGRLIGAEAAGRAVVDLLLSDEFGSEVISELRYNER